MNLIRYLDYFFVLRPILFFPGWSTTLAGNLVAHQRMNPIDSVTGPVDLPLVLICLTSAMVMGGGFLVNQVRDADTDRLNNKLFFLSQGFVTRKTAYAEAAVLFTLALVLTWPVSREVFLIYLPAIALFTVVYNIPPLALKDRVFGSVAANALMGLSAFAYGWFLADTRVDGFLAASLPYVLFNTGLYFLTTIPDAHGDQNTRKHTVCVAYGARTTTYCAAACHACALAAAVFNRDPLILVPTVLAVPFYVRTLIKPETRFAILTIKFGLLFFAAAVGLYHPGFLIAVAFFFFATRWYYRRRFQLTYPSFEGR
jgi:4-hydroxybenzoate polyprenyltransferase